MRVAAAVAVLLALALPAAAQAQAGTSYLVPPDNPFVGRAGAAPEIYSYGLRNPYRFAFDRANGDLVLGDVGQGSREEVDWATLRGRPGRELRLALPRGPDRGPGRPALPDRRPGGGTALRLPDRGQRGDRGLRGARSVARRAGRPLPLRRLLRRRGALAGARLLRPGRPHHRPHAGHRPARLLRAGRRRPAVRDRPGRGRRVPARAAPARARWRPPPVAGSYARPDLRDLPAGRLVAPVRGGAGRPGAGGAKRRGRWPLRSWTSRTWCWTAASAACCPWRSRRTTPPRDASTCTSRDTGGDIRIEEYRRSADPEPSGPRHPAPRAGDRALVGVEPQRRPAPVRPRRLPLRRHRRRRRQQRPPRQRPEPAAPGWASCCASIPTWCAGGGPLPRARDIRPPALRTAIPARQRVLRLGGVVGYSRCSERCTVSASARVLVGGRAYGSQGAHGRRAATRVRLKVRLTRRARRALGGRAAARRAPRGAPGAAGSRRRRQPLEARAPGAWPSGASQLGQAALEERPLHRVGREVARAPVGGGRLLAPAQPAQQVRPGGVQEVVVAPALPRTSRSSSSASPRSGPSAIATATARLSSTTGPGRTATSSS